MQFQVDLAGNSKPKDPETPWKGICSEQCWTAEGKRCRCSCGGAFHGLGNAHGENRAKRDQQHFDSKPGAQKYWQHIKKPTCLCGHDLHGQPILHYPHDAGWTVEGCNERQWLFITCPKCGYQNALWKLGRRTRSTANPVSRSQIE